MLEQTTLAYKNTRSRLNRRRLKCIVNERKRFINRKAEEQKRKIPPGTRLLSEEERLTTLKTLQETKAEAQKALEKLPISMKTLALAQRKTELEKKIDEMDQAIKTFSRKEVFIAE